MAWLNKLRNTIRPASLRRELDEELRLHIDLRARDFERQGMSRQEAHAEALRQFGNPTLESERARDVDVAGWIDSSFKDLRYAWRQLRRNPVFSGVAILSLALGVGANTAIFSVINAVVLRSLPVRNPQELVILTDPSESGSWSGLWDNERPWISYQEFLDLRKHLTTLSGLCAAGTSQETWQVRIGGGEQESMHGRLVSEEYFSVLGVEPAIGRFFNEQDAIGPGRDPYAVIGYDFWQRRFGGKADVLGTPLKLNGTILTIIGVAAPGFKGETVAQNPDFWVPIMMQPSIYPGRDRLHEDPTRSQEKIMWLHAFGRMKPEATLASVQSEVNVVFRGMLQAFYPPDLSPQRQKEAFSQYLVVREAKTGAFRGRENVASQLKIVLAVAGLVLLIACANVANLLLARATARQREVSVRLSIGASRGRLFRQFFTESLLLSGIGGAAGLLVAMGASRTLVLLLSDPASPYDLPPTLDWRVLAFTAGTTLFTGVLFGFAPALRASRASINVSLRESSPGVTRPGRRVTLAKTLVAGQVALSLLLIVGAGLFLRTLWNLQRVALGYPKERLLQVRVDGIIGGYKHQALVDFYSDVADRLRVLPGVQRVAYSQLGLMSGGETQDDVEVEGFTPQRDEDRESRFDYISPGYFATLDVPIILGRDLGAQDTAASQRVCIINEEFARHFFPGKSPLGRHITQRDDDVPSLPMEIVGVAKNARSTSLREEIPPRAYTPVSQAFQGRARGSVVFEIRTAAGPKAVLGAIRKTILATNPDVPITSSATMEEVIAEKTLGESQIARLCSIFGALALLLAATGLYGVLSYGVTRRTNEIGVRMALGASPGDVVRMVLRETAWLVAAGLVAGVIGSALTTRVIAARLYQLSSMDPLTIILALALLSAVAIVAGYIPASRAAKINPVLALRHE